MSEFEVIGDRRDYREQIDVLGPDLVAVAAAAFGRVLPLEVDGPRVVAVIEVVEREDPIQREWSRLSEIWQSRMVHQH